MSRLTMTETATHLVSQMGFGYPSECSDVIYLHREDMNIRVYDHKIEFGATKTWGGWARSIDFVSYHLPRSIEALEELVSYVAHLIEIDAYDHGWGEQNTVTYREAKRHWMRESLVEEEILAA